MRRLSRGQEDLGVLLCSMQAFSACQFLQRVQQRCKLPFSGLFIQVSEGGVVRQSDKAVFGSHLHPQGLEHHLACGCV